MREVERTLGGNGDEKHAGRNRGDNRNGSFRQRIKTGEAELDIVVPT